MPSEPSAPPAGSPRNLTAITGAVALIAIVLIVQMWLLTAALDAFLAGHRETALPAAIASGVLFSFCFLLYLSLQRIDVRRREVPRRGREPPSGSESEESPPLGAGLAREMRPPPRA
ncbi:MAG TPA: DUF6755 family protein [Candidatus Polarisedimenticolia bacterium]|nr:DUF6755 family protein [Candidatus Polarisedimenticolia bacterium]